MYVIAPTSLRVETYAAVRNNRVVGWTPHHRLAAHFTSRHGAETVAKTSPVETIVVECPCPVPWSTLTTAPSAE